MFNIMKLTIKAEKEESTQVVGSCLGKCLNKGVVVLMSGDLGAGKTTMTKAVAEGLGIDPAYVTSPTFAILHHFPEGRLPLVHVDLYRLGNNADLDEIGIEEYLDGEHVVIVEWSEHLPEQSPLKDRAILISLTFDDISCRTITFFIPQEFDDLISCLRKCFDKSELRYESTGA